MSEISLRLSLEQKKDILRLALILFSITAITALALSFVNEMTRDRIEEQRQLAVKNAMELVLPADSYEQLDITDYELDKIVADVYSAKSADGNELGYCVKVVPLGFGGEIQIVVGVDSESKVTQIDIVAMSETPGLGTKVKDEGFIAQFSAKSGVIKVVSGEASAEDNEISAVTGATVSSKAVTTGIQAAIDTVDIIKGGFDDVK